MTIERKDLESKFRQVKTAVDDTATTVKNVSIGLAIGAVVLMLLVYLIGKRTGKKGAAQLEIYRLG